MTARRSGAAAVLAAILALLLLAKPAAGVPRVETVAVGKSPVHAAVDAATGRVFVANAGDPRNGDGMSIGVLDASGHLATIPTIASPTHIAVSARHRRAVAVHPAGNFATLIDTTTLRTRTLVTGLQPVRALVVEATGLAYVLARGARAGPGSAPSSLTEIDLRSGLARTYPVDTFMAENFAASADGSRLYLIGTVRQPASDWNPGYVQAFDTAARTLEGAPMPIGRLPRQVIADPAGGSLFVAGHVNQERDEFPAHDNRRRSIRPALFVLDAETLATTRTVVLPDTTNLAAHGPLLTGPATFDAASGNVFVLDGLNDRLLVVQPFDGDVRAVQLEARGHALAVDAAAKTLWVSLAGLGQVAAFSLDGERLDTLSLGRAPSAGEAVGDAALAVDEANAVAYATSAHAGSLAVLRRSGEGTSGAVVNFTDFWVDPARPGSGLFVEQQGTRLFATLFVHDATGHPSWMFVSNARRQPDGSFAGDLYRTRGPLEEAIRNALPVGSLRFVPGSGDKASLVYYVDGGLNARVLERFRFNDAPRDCGWKVGTPSTADERANFTALWSNPVDPGWGLAVSQQGDTVFAVLFTYDELNRPTWAVMSNGRRNAAGAFAGDVYRAAEGRIQVAGSMNLAFTGPDSGQVRYRLSGLDFSAPLIRHHFDRLATRCRSR